jgi:predicted RNA binding protein YcfA (HicA-like mRNA interferase family)
VPSTSELIRRVKRAGCVMVKHGGRHDIWENPANGKRSSIPRHKAEMKPGIYHAILKELGLGDE